MKRVGKVVKIGGLNVWPHEELMADALAKVGHTIEFIPKSNRPHETTPDILIDGVKWEMKSPRSRSLKSVERNLKLGRWQSSRIVFTSKRMKGVPDTAIARELSKQLHVIEQITDVKFIDRHGRVIDIE